MTWNEVFEIWSYCKTVDKSCKIVWWKSRGSGASGYAILSNGIYCLDAEQALTVTGDGAHVLDPQSQLLHVLPDARKGVPVVV